MWLDLKDIIEMPGAEACFDCELPVETLDFRSVKAFLSAPHAIGRVHNSAGLLTVSGEITTKLLCECDRCGTEFETEKRTPIRATVSARPADDEDEDVYPIVNNGIDLDEIIYTCFVLDMDTKFLCRPDCLGLCPECGKNLNDGPCGCSKPLDPRLAVLGQLLDK